MSYPEQIDSAVREAVKNGLTSAYLSAPLINSLARILVGTARTSGTSLDTVVEIARNELDEAVVHYDKVLT